MSKWIKVEVDDDFSASDHEDLKLSYGGTDVSTRAFTPQYKTVLDCGFIGLVDFMGSDEGIVNAARVSYGEGTQKKRSDEGLIRYLMKHRHTTPFEMCEFQFHVKAPIFVFRQWHRHRTASINEYSGRYSEMSDEMYVPAPEDAMPQSQTNKQGRSDSTLSENDYNAIVTALRESYQLSSDTYQYNLKGKPVPEPIEKRRLWIEECAMNTIQRVRSENPDQVWTEDMIENKIREWYNTNELAIVSKDFPGLSRELARICLPVATYSQMYWKANLKNILHFISLRSDSHAQKEIRVYSDAMLELITPYVPWSIKAFMDYDMNGEKLSKAEFAILRTIIHDTDAISAIPGLLEDQGASQREITEFMKKISE